MSQQKGTILAQKEGFCNRNAEGYNIKRNKDIFIKRKGKEDLI